MGSLTNGCNAALGTLKNVTARLVKAPKPPDHRLASEYRLGRMCNMHAWRSSLKMTHAYIVKVRATFGMHVWALRYYHIS
jgi:hypothetical protein